MTTDNTTQITVSYTHLDVYKRQDFTDGEISVLDLLAKTKLVPSKGEARRLIDQGGISIDDEKVNSVTAKISKSSFEKGFVIIKKGKKVYHKAILS